jgi:UDP-N-acetylmuramate--alanine ligase
MDPTIVIGGRLDFLGSNAAWGEGSWLVAEADESDASFLQLSPELAVVTNIDPEHLDHYGSFDSLKKSFGDFLDRLPFYGRSVLCSDNDVLSALVTDLTKPYWTYGMSALPRPHFLIQNLRTNPQGSTFDVWFEGKLWIQLTIGVPGQHNVLNATAAAIVAREIGLLSDEITQGLKLFKGVQRRFEYKGRLGNHAVIEDYAHHPTEIRATLDAAKQAFPNEDLIVAYQPHRYSRTKDQWSEFSTCFVGARQVFTLPIYAASEPKPTDVDQWDGESFAKNIQGVHAKACRDFADLATRLRGACETASPLAPILVLGAGDIPKVIPLLLDSKSS